MNFNDQDQPSLADFSAMHTVNRRLQVLPTLVGKIHRIMTRSIDDPEEQQHL